MYRDLNGHGRGKIENKKLSSFDQLAAVRGKRGGISILGGSLRGGGVLIIGD